VPSAIAQEFCSGVGQCTPRGECQCDGQHAGPACEHDKIEILHNGQFDFKVVAGHYQYFRVHVPPRFPGGYVKVSVTSSAPAVVLVRYDDLPTKASYDLSNFDDWINQRLSTELKFKVEALGKPGGPGPDAGPPTFDGPESYGLGGRPPALGDGMEESVPGSPYQAEQGAPTLPRRLSSDKDSNSSFRQLLDDAECPAIAPKLTHASCFLPKFLHCEDACTKCLRCAQMDDKKPCSESCQECLKPECSQSLASCASDVSCSGPASQQCEEGCGSCMGCLLDSTDKRCGLCNCCSGCLPLAAKCMQNGATETRYVFVGVMHHRRFGMERGVISASADISLVEDESFGQTGLAEKSWTAELYNPFEDIRSVDMTHNQEYPEGEQFMYTMEIRQEAVAHLQVRTFSSRMTLLHLRNVNRLHSMQLTFLSGTEIAHVLTSSKASPKTLFDFDRAPAQVNGMVRIEAKDQENVWCAIFGRRDGYAQITVQSEGVSGDSTSVISPSLVLVCVAVLGGMCWCRGADSLSDGFASVVGRLAQERTPSQATEPLQGYSGSDVIDRTVEDQFLHRGGLGDEGL